MKKILVTILTVLILSGISFLVTAGLLKLASVAFGFKFTWLKALTIWLTWCAINSNLKIKITKED